MRRGGISKKLIFPLFFRILPYLTGCAQGLEGVPLEEAAGLETALEAKPEPPITVIEDRPGTPERPPYAAMMEPNEDGRVRIDFDLLSRISEEESEDDNRLFNLSRDTWKIPEKN